MSLSSDCTLDDLDLYLLTAPTALSSPPPPPPLSDEIKEYLRELEKPDERFVQSKIRYKKKKKSLLRMVLTRSVKNPSRAILEHLEREYWRNEELKRR